MSAAIGLAQTHRAHLTGLYTIPFPNALVMDMAGTPGATGVAQAEIIKTEEEAARTRAAAAELKFKQATVASGETPVVFDWDYLNAAHTADNPDWKVEVLDGTGYAGYYNQAINVDAPNPAAARLWQEFLYSDEVQNLWLKGGARPVRMEAMTEAGTIDEELASALPEAPEETVVPTEAQSTAAGELLGANWAAAVQ